jgi:hypothetical protein
MTYLITAVLAIFSAVAVAGQFNNVPVEIFDNEDGSFRVTGNMTSARISDNDVEYIGCGTRSTDVGGGNIAEFGFCQARDSAEVRAFCFTFNPALIQTIKSISDYSFLLFNINDVGECMSVGVSTQSFYIPKIKKSIDIF